MRTRHTGIPNIAAHSEQERKTETYIGILSIHTCCRDDPSLLLVFIEDD